MDIQAVLTGVGAIATGAGGVVIVVREFRKSDRKELKETVDSMSEDINNLRHDVLNCRRYAYDLAEILAEHRVDVPEPPALHQEAPAVKK